MTRKKPCVVLGVTGCIAAYKACEIVRGLQKNGCRVKVAMTPHATEFVGPATFRALTNEPVAVDLFCDPAEPIYHVSLADEADVMVIAPATANVVAKLAHGIADDLLNTTALAIQCPLVVAPAMNVNMYEAEVTQQNLDALRDRGVHIIDADEGYLACGATGRGRLAEPSVIVERVMRVIAEQGYNLDLAGQRVLITAGPTVEYIDPVRYISNPSSGKTGFALAEAAASRGAQVTVVSGPVALSFPDDVQVVSVQSAQDMMTACEAAFPSCDIAIFSAAVSDYRPVTVADHKLKKGKDDDALQVIELVANPDILATLAQGRADGYPVCIGFAAETHDVVANAKEKLMTKGADMIVANEVGEAKGFGTDTNQVYLVTEGGVEELPELSKTKLADLILDAAKKLT